MPENRPGLRGGGRDDVVIVSQTGAGAIIKGMAIFAQHQAIAHHAHLQAGHRIGVKPVEEGTRVAALHLDLPQRGHIAEAHARAGGAHLAVHRLAPGGFAGAGKVLRPHPLADLDKNRALRLGPRVGGRQAAGAEIGAGVATAQHTQRHAAIGRAEDGGAGFGDGGARQFRHHRKRGDIGGLALIGGHAQRGPAFQMFNRAHVFLMGERDVLDRDIVLKIDPGAALARDMPQGRGRGVAVLGGGKAGQGCADAQFGQRLLRALRPRCQRRRRAALTGSCADDGHAGRQGCAGDKGQTAFVPDRAAAMVAGQMDIRVPPARHAQRTGLNPGRLPIAGHGDACQAKAPTAVADHSPCQQRIGPLRPRLGAAVDHGGNVDPLGRQIQRRAVAIVIVGEDCHPARSAGSPAVGIGAHGARQQDARPVIVAERDMPFGGARRQQAAPRGDAPQRLARLVAGLGQVIRHPFHRAENAMIEGAENRCAAQDAQIRKAGEFRLQRRDPVGRGGIIQ